MGQFFTLFGLALLAFLILYLIGHFLLGLFCSDKGKTFHKLSISVVLIPSIYAIISTGGISIMTLNLILIGLLLIYSRDKWTFTFDWKQGGNPFDKEFLFSLVSFIVFFIAFYIDLSSNYVNPNMFGVDYLFYAREASYLKTFGIENTNNEFYNAFKGGTVPYHYHELWFTSMLSSIFKTHSLSTLLLFTYTIIYTTIASGVVYLVRIIKATFQQELKMIDYLIVVLFFMLSVPDISFLVGIDALKISGWVFPVLGHHKLILIYFFMLWIITSVIQRQYFAVAIFSSLLVVSQVSVSISLMISTGLYLLYIGFTSKWKLKQYAIHLMPLVVTTVFFYFFYALFGDDNNIALSNNEILDQYDSKEELMRCINIIGKTTLQALYNLFPFVLFFLLTRKKKVIWKKDFLLFTLFSMFSGLFVWAALNQMQDSVQLWSNMFTVSSNVGMLVSIILLVIYIKRKSFYVLPVLILLFSTQYYLFNQKYKEEPIELDQSIKELVTLEPNFVFLKQASDYQVSTQKYEQIYIGQVYHLMQLFDPLKITCLSMDQIKVETAIEKKYVVLNTFYKYIEDLKAKEEHTSFEEAQLKFINENAINYVLVYKNRELPVHFTQLFKPKAVGTVDGYSMYERK